MLGIIISYHSFFEFLPHQLENIKKYVKVPYTVYIVDNCQQQQTISGSFVYLRNPLLINHPSLRHQESVNMGLQAAWNSCDSFLIFDNDMIFLSEWNEPKEDMMYELVSRGEWEYCWQNILYLKKKWDKPFVFSFYKCPKTGEQTDSGGNSGLLLRDKSITKRKLRYVYKFDTERESCLPSFQIPYKQLCDEYKTFWWFDVYDFNSTLIFHYRAMSNYCNLPVDFLNKKKQLILSTIKDA
jgi:hypothetical protein